MQHVSISNVGHIHIGLSTVD